MSTDGRGEDGGDGPRIALEYSAPPPFFIGEYRSRNASALTTGVLCVAFGCLAAAAAIASPSPDARRLLPGVAVVLFLVGGWELWQWHADVVRPVRVTADGIEARGRLWPWPRIAKVGGLRGHGHGVTLFFVPRGRFASRQLVETTPALTEDAYRSLRVQLDHHFRTRWIAVEVARDLLFESAD